MIALYIIGGILLLLALLLFARVRLVLSYEGRPRLELRYLFFRFRLYPRPKKKPPRYSRRAARKLKRELKRRRRAKQKQAQTKPAPKAGGKAPKKPAAHHALHFSDIRLLLNLLKSFLKPVTGQARNHTTVRIRRLWITVGGEDAAAVALQYGAVSQLLAYFLAFLDHNLRVRNRRRAKIGVNADFLSEGYTLHLDAALSCPLIFAAGLVLTALKGGLYSYKKWNRHWDEPKKGSANHSKTREES